MTSRRKLGINFGPENLSIVEVEKQRIIRHYHIPFMELQDKAEVVDVADQIMLAAVLQKTLRDKSIKSDEIIATVPSKEVLLRSFLIPVLPQREVKSVIDFEVRKYMPIKLDLLSFDYVLQKVKEKGGAKFKTHFIGIKKEILDKFIYALEQSNLKIICIETAPLSLFRVLAYKKLAKIDSNIAIVEANKNEGSICIIEKGFPHLIRDFKLATISKDIYTKEQETIFAVLNKELRQSFDYYRRQTGKSEIDHIFIFSEENDELIKDHLSREFNIKTSFIRPDEILGLKEEIKIGELKAYGAALRSFFAQAIAIDLYKKKNAVEQKEKKEEVEIPEAPISVKTAIRTAVISVVFILLFYLFVDYSQMTALKNKLDSLSKRRLSLKHKLSSLNLTDLQSIKNVYEEQINALTEVKKTTYATPLLNILPSLIPNGAWLARIDLRLDPELIFKLEGKAYLEEEAEQIKAVNKFASNIKENTEFKKIFSTIDLDYVKQSMIDDFAVSEFGITCK